MRALAGRGRVAEGRKAVAEDFVGIANRPVGDEPREAELFQPEEFDVSGERSKLAMGVGW